MGEFLCKLGLHSWFWIASSDRPYYVCKRNWEHKVRQYSNNYPFSVRLYLVKGSFKLLWNDFFGRKGR